MLVYFKVNDGKSLDSDSETDPMKTVVSDDSSETPTKRSEVGVQMSTEPNITKNTLNQEGLETLESGGSKESVSVLLWTTFILGKGFIMIYNCFKVTNGEASCIVSEKTAIIVHESLSSDSKSFTVPMTNKVAFEPLVSKHFNVVTFK